MRSVFLILVTVMAVAASSFTSGNKDTVTKDTVLNAIATFRIEPRSQTGRAAAAVIIDFAEKSHDVAVNISQKALPFLSKKQNSSPERGTLMAAFIAGNIDAQLLRGEKKDEPYAGELQVIDTYRQMQRTNPKLRIAEVDKFIELEKRGELKRYVSPP